MLFRSFDVNNGVSRRAWAGNSGALSAVDQINGLDGFQITRSSVPDVTKIEAILNSRK